MLANIRNSYGLTRNDVALLTRRSVNYVLKAEQATFPAAPIALLDFYANQDFPGEDSQLRTPWEPMDRDVMRSAYRDYQRRQRRAWLDNWEPLPQHTVGYPFRFKWRRRPDEHLLTAQREAGAVGFFTPQEDVYSSQYGISVGLCLPAAVIYRNELAPASHAGAIRECMEDLVDYVTMGEFEATRFGDAGVMDEVSAVLRIAEEEGVTIAHDRIGGISSAA